MIVWTCRSTFFSARLSVYIMARVILVLVPKLSIFCTTTTTTTTTTTGTRTICSYNFQT